ncbi:hypothetical protein COT47_01935 [Candidatus Woesearchaeota archaeon CG08_land_8_20_14_0_20_43_7]|nr:MAG: hypothetical protein COT47_01935 [Candidatus Woesearchaeota archaeon CG08_land_8_20_14_0_20_43_7]
MGKQTTEERAIAFVKERWQYFVMAGVLLLLFLIQFSVVSEFKHIPGPIYGGDLYREKGFTLNILNGDPFWEDPYHKGEYAFYPPFGYLVAAGLTDLFSTDVETVLIYIPLLITILIGIGGFVFGRALFKNDTYGLLFGIIAVTLETFVHYKHTYGIGYFFVLLTLASFLEIRDSKRLFWKIFGGISYGMVALSHYKPFIYTTVIILSHLLFEFIYQARKGEKKLDLLIGYLKDYWIMASIAIAISLIFFGPLMFVYHLKTINLTNQYSLFDPDKNGISWVFRLVWGSFWMTVNLSYFIWGALSFVGVIYCYLNFKNESCRFILFAFIGMVLASGHYLITRPLFNNWIVPSHVAGGLLIPRLVLLLFGIRMIASSLKKVKKADYIVAGIMLLVIIMPIYARNIQKNDENQWVQYGRQMDPSTQALFDIGDWLQKSTSKDAVFLANDESAFMINAMGGRKVVAVRRTHASPYVDEDKRYADAMVMLYGDNEETQKKLIEEHGVKYLYVDSFLLNYPMLTHPRFASYLKDNGIQFTQQMVRLDPSSADAPQYDYLVVQPQNVTALKLFSPDKEIMINGQLYSAFYKYG